MACTSYIPVFYKVVDASKYLKDAGKKIGIVESSVKHLFGVVPKDVETQLCRLRACHENLENAYNKTSTCTETLYYIIDLCISMYQQIVALLDLYVRDKTITVDKKPKILRILEECQLVVESASNLCATNTSNAHTRVVYETIMSVFGNILAYRNDIDFDIPDSKENSGLIALKDIDIADKTLNSGRTKRPVKLSVTRGESTEAA